MVWGGRARRTNPSGTEVESRQRPAICGPRAPRVVDLGRRTVGDFDFCDLGKGERRAEE